MTQTTPQSLRLLRAPTAVLSAGLLAAGLMLTGCGGGGDTDAYCDTLSKTQDDINALDSGDPAALSTAFDAFDKLADEAPDEVADDWKTMQEGVDKIEAAFEDAGLQLDQLGDLTSGNIPDGVDPDKLADLGTTLQELSSDEFQAAADNIEKHAKDECDITLGN